MAKQKGNLIVMNAELLEAAILGLRVNVEKSRNRLPSFD